jgi:hypothetical protein
VRCCGTRGILQEKFAMIRVHADANSKSESNGRNYMYKQVHMKVAAELNRLKVFIYASVLKLQQMIVEI